MWSASFEESRKQERKDSERTESLMLERTTSFCILYILCPSSHCLLRMRDIGYYERKLYASMAQEHLCLL